MAQEYSSQLHYYKKTLDYVYKQNIIDHLSVIDIIRNGVITMSKLEIHVYTGKNNDGNYESHSFIQASDPNSRVRASMVESGAKAAAMMSSSHTKSLSHEKTTSQMLDYRSQKLIGE